jgi:putative PIN family toxin of toxin-antitoxin system
VIVVLDANILAPMVLASATGVLGRILAAWRQGQFTVVVSDHLLDEAQRALLNPYFSRRITTTEVRLYLSFVRILARHVTISVAVSGVATHPEDDLVLATAVSAGADYLVTGDRRFRARVPSYQGVRLVTPAEFLTIIAP